MTDVKISTILKSNNLSPHLASQLYEADINGDGNISVDELLNVLTKKYDVEKTNQNLKKTLMLTAVFILLLAGSNLATSVLAVRLSKEVKVSLGGNLLSITGDKVSTKSSGVTEFLWYERTTPEETESGVVATGCVQEEQLQNIMKGATDGTPVVTGFADVDGVGEQLLELSSNVYSGANNTCVTSKDGKFKLCFSDEDCETGTQRRLEARTKTCENFDNERTHGDGKRGLSQTTTVARRLCEDATYSSTGNPSHRQLWSIWKQFNLHFMT